MSIQKLEFLSKLELKKLSLEKDGLGIATPDAYQAQVELQERSLHYDGDKNNRYNSSDVKSFEDYDYSSEAYINACSRAGRSR